MPTKKTTKKRAKRGGGEQEKEPAAKRQKRVRVKAELDGTVGAAEVCRALAGAGNKPLTRQTLSRYRKRGLPYVQVNERTFRYPLDACLAWAREDARKGTAARSGQHGTNALGEPLKGSAGDERARPLDQRDPYAARDVVELDMMLAAERIVEQRMKNARAAAEVVSVDDVRRHMGKLMHGFGRLCEAMETRLVSAVGTSLGLDPEHAEKARDAIGEQLDLLRQRLAAWDWMEEEEGEADPESQRARAPEGEG